MDRITKCMADSFLSLVGICIEDMLSGAQPLIYVQTLLGRWLMSSK